MRCKPLLPVKKDKKVYEIYFKILHKRKQIILLLGHCVDLCILTVGDSVGKTLKVATRREFQEEHVDEGRAGLGHSVEEEEVIPSNPGSVQPRPREITQFRVEIGPLVVVMTADREADSNH